MAVDGDRRRCGHRAMVGRGRFEGILPMCHWYVDLGGEEEDTRVVRADVYRTLGLVCVVADMPAKMHWAAGLRFFNA
jgi:hypothetical protein